MEAELTKPKSSTILLGSYGRGNLGDDVFLVAASELFTNHRLYINSADDNLLPPNAQGLVSTISTTSRRDILKKLKVFLQVKNIIYWGGDVWVELYGDRFPRQSLYKMVILNALARLWGKKIHYVGCGIGRLEGWSLKLARTSARFAHTIISREQRSAEVLGLPRTQVLPDLAINLPYYQPKLHKLPTKRTPFTVGISLLYHLPSPKQNFPKLVEHMTQFITSLSKGKFKAVLLPMLVSRQESFDDLWASEQVKERVRSVGGSCDIYQPTSLHDLIEALGKFHLVIGTRLHANILGTFNATPCLGIAYRAKVSSFFDDNNLNQYCTDLNSLKRLPQLFQEMYDHYDEAAQQFYDISQHNLTKRSAYQEFAEQYG